MGTFINLIAVFFVGLISGFVGAVAGGGGLISIPFLIFLGLPPQVAIATSKFGGVGLSFGAIVKFIKEKKIVWKYIPFLIAISLIGGYIGANILLAVKSEVLSKVVGIILLLLLPTLFIKKEIGLENRVVTKRKRALGFFLYFLIMTFGGFFGGVGSLAIYTLMFFLGLTIIKANATDIVPWFFMSLFATAIFMFNGIVDYQYGIVIFFGMIIGGYIGAHTAIRKGNKWVKLVFATVIIVSAIKILFF